MNNIKGFFQKREVNSSSLFTPIFLTAVLVLVSILSPFKNLYAFATGTLDTTFDPGTSVNAAVESMAIQSDGKVIIGGDFTSYNGTLINRIARLNSDGSLDTTFNPGTGANNTISDVAIQSDGKIIIAGGFTNYNGTLINRIARLNSDGSLDTTFNPGTGSSGYIHSVSIQSNGKIIIGGNFTSYNGTSRNRIARINANGTLDTTFSTVAGANAAILKTNIQSDGKIIIGGLFLKYNGTTRNRIARLNANGTLDTTFNPGTGANGAVESITIQSDGKIIIGGQFNRYNSAVIVRSGIARVNANGTLDTTFDPGLGANAFVYSTHLQSDGKVIIGGDFTSYNGTLINRIARLNSDGSLDTTFNPGTGANGMVTVINLQSDDNILIAGLFTSYNDTNRKVIARIN